MARRFRPHTFADLPTALAAAGPLERLGEDLLDDGAPAPMAARGAQDIVDDVVDEARGRAEDEVRDRSGGAVSSDGTINYEAVVGQILRDIEIRTALSPSITLTAADLMRNRNTGNAQPGKDGDMLRRIKPTVIVRLKQNLGTKVIAPGGVATGKEWENLLPWLFAGGVAGVLFMGGIFGVGYWLGKRRQTGMTTTEA